MPSLGTVVIGAIVIGALVFAIYRMYKNRNSCAGCPSVGGCGGCPSMGTQEENHE